MGEGKEPSAEHSYIPGQGDAFLKTRPALLKLRLTARVRQARLTQALAQPLDVVVLVAHVSLQFVFLLKKMAAFCLTLSGPHTFNSNTPTAPPAFSSDGTAERRRGQARAA